MPAPHRPIALVCLLLAACDTRAGRNAPPGGSAPAAAVEDSLRRLEQEWADAVRTRDSAALERLIAADFTLSSEGSTDPAVPRSTWMTNTLQNLRVDSIRLSPAQVVVHGDTAMATLDFFWSGRFKEMPPFRDSTRLTDTWVRGPASWQALRRVLAD